MNIVEIDNLTFKYENKTIFEKFSLNIKEGEFVTICGANTSGKTTLIKLITGIYFSNNNIKVCNEVVSKKNIFNIRKNMGVIFDDLDNYFVCDTVIEDIAFIMENLNYSKEKMKKNIDSITKNLGISDLLYKNPYELSGGEKCKVALACALVHNPKILILDDTLSMIDNDEKEKIVKLLKKLNKRGLTIIQATNDLSLTYFCDKLIVLDNGKIVLNDLPLNVMKNDSLLNKLSIELPFEIELSKKLMLYGLIDNLEINTEDMVNKLWL